MEIPTFRALSLDLEDLMATHSQLEAAQAVSQRVVMPDKGHTLEIELKASKAGVARRVANRREWQETWQLAKEPSYPR